MSSTVHPKLSHLLPEQVQLLMDKYYGGGYTNKQLMEEFQIEAPVSRLVSFFPPIVQEDKACPYCVVPLIQQRPSKSYVSYPNPSFCPQCNHRESNQCMCPNCVYLRKEEAAVLVDQRKKIVLEKYRATGIKIEYWDFEIRVLCYCLAFVRAGVTEDYFSIASLDELQCRLSPSRTLDEQIIRDLYSAGLISVHNETPQNVFSFDGDEIKTIPLRKVRFRIGNFLEAKDARVFVEEVTIYLRGIDLLERESEIRNLWETVALEECLAYLEWRLTKKNLPYKPGDKTRDTLRDVLSDHSVGQAFKYIWMATESAAAFAMEDGVSTKFAANTFSNKVLKFLERNRALGIVERSYNREERNLPQSLLSVILFNVLLRTPGTGLDRPVFPTFDAQ
jgi:hypothetical protein